MANPSTTDSDILPDLDDVVARGNAMVERVADEVAIIDLSTHRVSTLNKLGARIWDALDEPKSIRRCAEQLALDVNVPLAQLQHDTQSFVAVLLKRGLLVRQ
jgi:Coenzyme PQQ synthesis protein D (PqqD)